MSGIANALVNIAQRPDGPRIFRLGIAAALAFYALVGAAMVWL